MRFYEIINEGDTGATNIVKNDSWMFKWRGDTYVSEYSKSKSRDEAIARKVAADITTFLEDYGSLEVMSDEFGRSYADLNEFARELIIDQLSFSEHSVFNEREGNYGSIETEVVNAADSVLSKYNFDKIQHAFDKSKVYDFYKRLGNSVRSGSRKPIKPGTKSD
jgi:hypothetical protein